MRNIADVQVSVDEETGWFVAVLLDADGVEVDNVHAPSLTSLVSQMVGSGDARLVERALAAAKAAR